jgi:hypothetical protein
MVLEQMQRHFLELAVISPAPLTASPAEVCTSKTATSDICNPLFTPHSVRELHGTITTHTCRYKYNCITAKLVACQNYALLKICNTSLRYY